PLRTDPAVTTPHRLVTYPGKVHVHERVGAPQALDQLLLAIVVRHAGTARRAPKRPSAWGADPAPLPAPAGRRIRFVSSPSQKPIPRDHETIASVETPAAGKPAAGPPRRRLLRCDTWGRMS